MDYIIKLNDQLYGAPIGVLIGFFAIVLGYLLKTIPNFDNRYIPIVVVLSSTIGFMLISPECPPEIKHRIWQVRNFIIGFIIGFAAWTFHAQILRRFIDPKLFPNEAQPAAPETSTKPDEQPLVDEPRP